MRVIVQRINYGRCLVVGQVVSSVNKGLMLFVSFTHKDDFDEIDKMAKKIANLRIFEDENQKMNLSILDIKGEILSISQFTLYANPYTGNRPSFTNAMHPKVAKPLYERFNRILSETYHIPTASGIFGADMKLDIECDGPVTISLEYEEELHE